MLPLKATYIKSVRTYCTIKSLTACNADLPFYCRLKNKLTDATICRGSCQSQHQQFMITRNDFGFMSDALKRVDSLPTERTHQARLRLHRCRHLNTHSLALNNKTEG